MTLDEWNQFKLKLIPGCTFEYKSSSYGWTNDSTFPIFVFAIIKDNLNAAFENLSWDQDWDILKIGSMNCTSLYNFCWPDGTLMRGWQTCEKPVPLTKEQCIIKKCQSLDKAFKNKTLPRCKTKPLPFPDKKKISSKVKFDVQQEYATYVPYTLTIPSPVRVHQSRFYSWTFP